MSIALLSEEDRERWDRYVIDSAPSACYHLIGWKDVVEQSFGHRTYYLFSEDGEKNLNGILPLVHMKSMVFGNFMVSLPYFNYGGTCAECGDVRQELLEEAVRIAGEEKASHIELRHTENVYAGLRVKTTKVSMQLELPGDCGELWRSLPSKLRSQIRRPEKGGMYARSGREEELDSFYTVFSRNMRDLGTPVYPKTFFGNILAAFPNSSWIHTVYTKGGRPVASGFLLGFKHRMEIPWASSIRGFNRYSPNMLLYWSCLRFAYESGYRVFDFGRSTPGEGTHKFKEQWDSKPVQLYWHYWLRGNGSVPEMNPGNPKYRMAIRIWRRLPVSLANTIGPPIVRNLP